MATEIEATMLRLLAESHGKTLSPIDVARALIVGPGWNVLMPEVRRAAIKLALAKRLVITRKGKAVDPNDFKGVYRLAPPPQEP
jgi:hypothetical protein